MKKPERLIVFFVPEDKLVNGGILSVFSICKVSREFKSIHGSEVVLSTPPGAKSYRKNDLFENSETIYDFDDIVKGGPYKSLLLQIPEFASYNTFIALKKYPDFISSIPDFKVNILNQNILIMQPPEEVALWFSLTPNLTQTTAHNKYSTQDLADAYSIPTHHLSTFVDHTQYKILGYDEKKPIIALSHDQSKLRSNIEQKLRKNLPDYEIVTVQNMKYEEYKEFIATARYVITFGEGFDGYYVEAFFTGGICFAVYNNDFFPDKAFGHFGNTYESEDQMLKNIVEDIKKLDNDRLTYQKINKQNLTKINALYSFDNYRKNIELFYAGKYKLIPSTESRTELLGSFIRETEHARDRDRATIARLSKAVEDMEKMIADKSKAIVELDAKILDMEHSKSWKITKPLRKASSIGKKK